MHLHTLKQQIESAGVDVSTLVWADRKGTVAVMDVPTGKEGMRVWRRLRSMVGVTARWPIFVGYWDGGAEELYSVNGEPDSAAILADVPQGKPLSLLRSWTDTRQRDFIRHLESQGKSAAAFLKQSLSSLEFAREMMDKETRDTRSFPAQPPRSVRKVARVLREGRGERCHLALVPTINPADAPAYVPCGDFNESPPPWLHIAFLRDWQARFGAVPIAMVRESIECIVDRPPETPLDALNLAYEHSEYCADVATQIYDSPEDLGIALWQAPNWYFWWD